MDQQACILVVDDDADIVNAVRLYLEKEGFCVYGAAGAAGGGARRPASARPRR